MIKHTALILLVISGGIMHHAAKAQSQYFADSSRFQVHFQQTVVEQYHPGFNARYTGRNSLVQLEEAQTSLTTTFYTGYRIAKYTQLYFNPEIAGGAGLSRATGMAGFPNGETFRVGNPKPQIYVARFQVVQTFPLSKTRVYQPEVINQLAGGTPASYLQLVAGRISISDWFDNNTYSHDPRTQFLNWALMSNGAYDYAANTRGYTWGFVSRLVLNQWQLAFAGAMVPRNANGSDMDPHIQKAHALQAELSWNWGNPDKPGCVRLLVYQNAANMGNYNQAVLLGQLNNDTASIVPTRVAGSLKTGVGIGFEQGLTPHTGIFGRASWNDGKHETWMFTEIDRSVSLGISGDGSRWKRNGDHWGLAAVCNGLSASHRRFLAAGGTGFMIGDGMLNYSPEAIAEVFYNAELFKQHFYITPDYQFVINPAYNRDRGPVSIFGLRVQTRF